MTDNEFDKLVIQHGWPLVNYCNNLASLASYYSNGSSDEPEDGPKEAAMRIHMGSHMGSTIHKLQDLFGNVSHPPIDGFDLTRVYEFKLVTAVTRFQDLTTTDSKGAFVDRFKVQHLDLACGRNLIRRQTNRFFEEGYYVYMDQSMNVFYLSVTEIWDLVESGRTIPKPGWGGKGQRGWMIHPDLWHKAGCAIPRRRSVVV